MPSRLRASTGPGCWRWSRTTTANTYRAVYTVKFAGLVYVLHAFQKKSERGVKTSAEEIEKVKTRLMEAEKHHAEWSAKQKKDDEGHH